MEHTFSSQHPGHCARKGKATHVEPNWRHHLPALYSEAIIVPLYFKKYREYEISADRCVGYDADDQPCHIAYRVELTRIASDDDEEFYEVVSYREELSAWLLRDDRWLVFRATLTDPCTPTRDFYAISPDMPR